MQREWYTPCARQWRDRHGQEGPRGRGMEGGGALGGGETGKGERPPACAVRTCAHGKALCLRTPRGGVRAGEQPAALGKERWCGLGRVRRGLRAKPAEPQPPERRPGLVCSTPPTHPPPSTCATQVPPSLLWARTAFRSSPGLSHPQKDKPFGSLLVFRAQDAAGKKNTHRGRGVVAPPQPPRPPLRPHSTWPPAKWCNDRPRAGLVVMETRKPEMRLARSFRAVGGRIGVTGPGREDVRRSWQGRVVLVAARG